MKIEPGKFYKTRGGEKVHVLGRREDDNEKYQFVGYIVGGETQSWDINGLVPSAINMNLKDLIEEWVEPVEHTFWVNVYPYVVCAYESRKDADKDAEPDRVACVKVTCEEGQWDDE